MSKANLGSYAHTLLRIVAGFTYSLHGFQKLFGYFGGLPHGAHAHAFSEMWIAGVLECFGGLLVLVGLFTRPVAFLLCGEMAVAYFTQHLPRGFWPITNGGEPAVLYCFIFSVPDGGGRRPLEPGQNRAQEELTLCALRSRLGLKR